MDNIASSGITYNENPSGYRPNTFSWIRYPHQRYYLDTPYSSLVHRAPFEMIFQPHVVFNAQSGSNFNYIKIVYPSTFGDASLVRIRDLQVFRPVCYLNNARIKNCVINTVTKEITMGFLFGLTLNQKYHLKFSILDSRNPDIDGFLANLAISNVVFMYKPYGTANWFYT